MIGLLKTYGTGMVFKDCSFWGGSFGLSTGPSFIGLDENAQPEIDFKNAIIIVDKEPVEIKGIKVIRKGNFEGLYRNKWRLTIKVLKRIWWNK